MSARRTHIVVIALCLATAAVTVAVSPAHAQGTTFYTRASFGAINYEDRSAATASLYGWTQYGGQSMATSGEFTYSFGDGRGTSLGSLSDDIRIAGAAWGRSTGLGFFDLKAGVRATLENAYLDLRDVANAPNIAGMRAPYFWIASAGAGWTHTARFNGIGVAGSGHTVKWIFGVDGVVNDIDAGIGFAYMGFQYGANPRYRFNTSSLAPQSWATPSMPVTWGDAVQTNASFNTDWQYSMLGEAEEVYDENETLLGYVAPSALQGTVDYSSTMKLQEIQVFAPDGSRFYDFTVDDGAGNVFYSGNTAAASVPESGSAALAGLALLMAGLLRRRPIALSRK